mgnify:CR=1 FL=1
MAVGQDPYDWMSPQGKTPVDHLLSLQKADGAFKWKATNDGALEWRTADVVAALLGKPHPVSPWYQTKSEKPGDIRGFLNSGYWR